MATISIAGNTLSGCLGAGSFAGIGTAFSNVKKNTNSLTQSISSLKSKVSAAAQAADVSASANSTSRALSRENQKQSAVSLVYDKLDKLISNAGKVDNLASGAVEKLKQEFYRKYSYLKPECEKGLREKAADLFKGAWDGLCSIHNAIANFVCDAVEWVKENWEAIVVVLVAIVAIIAVALSFGSLSGLLIVIGVGFLLGMTKEVVSSSIAFLLTGKWEFSFKKMFLSGIKGAVDAIFTAAGCPFMGSLVSTILEDGLDALISGKKLNIGNLAKDICIDMAFTLVFQSIFPGKTLKDKANTGLNKWLSQFEPFKRFAGRGSYNSSFKGAMTNLYKGNWKTITWKTLRNGFIPATTKTTFSTIWNTGEKLIKGGISGLLKNRFNINFDFNIGGFDLFKLLKIS